jgi:hypothetical protein
MTVYTWGECVLWLLIDKQNVHNGRCKNVWDLARSLFDLVVEVRFVCGLRNNGNVVWVNDIIILIGP